MAIFLTPASASLSAMPRPRPRELPVTSAVFCGIVIGISASPCPDHRSDNPASVTLGVASRPGLEEVLAHGDLVSTVSKGDCWLAPTKRHAPPRWRGACGRAPQ